MTVGDDALPTYVLEGHASPGDVLELHPDGKLRRKPPTPPPVREDLGTHTCGRRTETGKPPTGEPGPDVWRVLQGSNAAVCSFCGSMHPDDFMRHVEGGSEIEPTDKNYKAYVRGAPGPGKFYFHHLPQPQRDRFIELHNNGTMKIGYPGRFYRMPFFCAPRPAGG